MRFTHELAYDAAPSVVASMLADPRFREKVCDATRAVRRQVDVVGSADQPHTVVVDQTQPATGIPSVARKFVGEEITIVQRESWSGDSGATFVVEIPGKPATFTGSIALVPDGEGTVEQVSGDVTVKVPFLGSKLEGMVADLFTSALRTEQRVGRAWLAGDH